MRFFLGTHRSSWLERTAVPLFISRRTMPTRRLPRASGQWALDSGGFSELSMFGAWKTSAQEYAAEVRRFALDWRERLLEAVERAARQPETASLFADVA